MYLGTAEACTLLAAEKSRWGGRTGRVSARSRLGVPVGGHISIARASEGFQRSPLVQMKAESEHFKLAYHKIWICISRYGLDTTKAP